MKTILKLILTILAILSVLVGGYLVASSQNKPILYNDKTQQFIHEPPSKIINRLRKKEQGIYYFGFPSCPWCLELLPVLDKALKEENMKAYIVNTRHDTYTDDNNKIIQEFYQKYTKDKQLSVPFVVSINSLKKVNVHVGTVNNHDATKNKMNSQQEKRLTKLLNDMIYFSKN